MREARRQAGSIPHAQQFPPRHTVAQPIRLIVNRKHVVPTDADKASLLYRNREAHRNRNPSRPAAPIAPPTTGVSNGHNVHIAALVHAVNYDERKLHNSHVTKPTSNEWMRIRINAYSLNRFRHTFVEASRGALRLGPIPCLCYANFHAGRRDEIRSRLEVRLQLSLHLLPRDSRRTVVGAALQLGEKARIVDR